MTIFSDKLDRIRETISLVAAADLQPLARALNEGRERIVMAVGSGGSAVCAEYLARCRATLECAPTIVQTPMDLVLDCSDLSRREVWLFSAGADNPDIAAAFRAALNMHAASIRLVTARGTGATALQAAAQERCELHIVPVADEKDGFLATHSMIASVAALLFGAVALDHPGESERLKTEFIGAASSALTHESRADLKGTFAQFHSKGTLIVLHDPQLRAVGVLIETSLWETAICAAQRTDFRNFAHGRHVWLAKRLESCSLLALTSTESVPIWSALNGLLPTQLLRSSIHFGNAGRFKVALAIVKGLALVEALGMAVGIDPGRPGAGEFARRIYEDRSLDDLSTHLSPSVRHKWTALLRRDEIRPSDVSMCIKGHEKRADLSRAIFCGLVLDYDGTMVPTDDRLDPPANEIIEELIRLIDAGIRVAIATGRGGSAGEMLRQVMPVRVHQEVMIGYYNGAFIRTLNVDIGESPPAPNPDIAEAADWLGASALFLAGRKIKRGPLQMTINHADLADPYSFVGAIAACPPVADGRVKIRRSQHSFDLIPSSTSKAEVVRRIEELIGDPNTSVLAVGDSGGWGGNDHELLASRHGVSVGTVCGNPDGSWTLFGRSVAGPLALLRILTSLKEEPAGGVRLDVHSFESVD